ncbi:GNAT family N-acetyltransferase [Shouchella patagoniensis]|uniref:GNAT family N-acetyltransferase n=1 Tax=Shouchella patagoniensis TaxID=228576 RepID=UPI000995AAB4
MTPISVQSTSFNKSFFPLRRKVSLYFLRISGELDRIWNQFQRQGFGKYLLNKVAEIAKEKGKSVIWLGV